jgi:hypothetical protein
MVTAPKPKPRPVGDAIDLEEQRHVRLAQAAAARGDLPRLRALLSDYAQRFPRPKFAREMNQLRP